MNRTVLITGAGGPAGRALASMLTRRGFCVHGTDIHVVELPGVITHVIPPATETGFLGSLRKLTRDTGAALLIPTVTEELPLVATCRPAFEPLTRVAIADAGPIALANDKLATALSLHAHGVPVPKFAIPSDFGDAATALTAMGGPLVVKPRCSRGGRGVVVIETPDDVDWSSIDDDCIVQEFAPGIEYAPMSYRSSQGRRPTTVVLEKTGLAHGRVGNATGVRPVGGGLAEDVKRVAKATMEAMGLVGPADMDIRRNARGLPVVLEVNARFGANSVSAPTILDEVVAEAFRYGEERASA